MEFVKVERNREGRNIARSSNGRTPDFGSVESWFESKPGSSSQCSIEVRPESVVEAFSNAFFGLSRGENLSNKVAIVICTKSTPFGEFFKS